ncbi:cytochrome C551 [Chryseobacterium sp. SIMBA_029]|uniref:cytochrome C551 n=1 Tax=Chryseobacterium sp. SIMBA_029 TaxID=3085772 RepID=UPI00397B56CE
MKKLLLLTAGLGLLAVSCGTKESSMSSGSTDSTAASSKTMSPVTTDTTATAKMKPDTLKVDSVAAPATR